MHEKNLIVGQYYPELNGLRALAVIAVIIVHCNGRSGAEAITYINHCYSNIMSTGWIGVDLFFVLSGFLITGILLDTCKEKGYFKNFFIRRAVRILPLYYLTLLLFFPFMLLIGNLDTFSPHYLMYIFHLGNWNVLFELEQPKELVHLWSLAVEEQFYIFWPILMLIFVRRRLSIPLCLFVIITSIIVRIALVLNDLNYPAYEITIARLDGLASGALLAILMKEKRDDLLNLKNTNKLFIMGMATIITLFHINGNFFGRSSLIVTLGIASLPMVFIPLILWTFLLDKTHPYRRFLASKPLIFIGKISYGMYVYHMFIILGLAELVIIPQDVFGYHITQLLFFLLSLFSTIIIAWISYTFFESKILKLKNRWAPYEQK